jgi:pyruvate-ferredoxin/flavodoxin oxidoreductase
LFEDNAEFGYGMQLAIDYQRDEVYSLLQTLANSANTPQEVKDAINQLIALKNHNDSWAKSKHVIELLKKLDDPISREIITKADQLPNKSTWIIGGDG